MTLIFISTCNKCAGVLQGVFKAATEATQRNSVFERTTFVLYCRANTLLQHNASYWSHRAITAHVGALWILWALWLFNSKYAVVKKKKAPKCPYMSPRLSGAAENAFIWQATAMHHAHDIRIVCTYIGWLSGTVKACTHCLHRLFTVGSRVAKGAVVGFLLQFHFSLL